MKVMNKSKNATNKARNHHEAKVVARKKAEKRAREERFAQEEASADRAAAEERYWEPVDKKDKRHKEKLLAKHTQARAKVEKAKEKALLNMEEDV